MCFEDHSPVCVIGEGLELSLIGLMDLVEYQWSRYVWCCSRSVALMFVPAVFGVPCSVFV